ncbi:carbon storage regulator [Halobacillus salinarum]|uniref:Carbon storage regulator n=1 Tax=Halobacillus salinarum TaxID=2932257 RepID=A0ABY4EH72_9BACI|nr:carbon storage regulator [Halobacillus salinarum]UOQ43340.1 carbon storage regulator [Halobacillus salinarum]
MALILGRKLGEKIFIQDQQGNEMEIEIVKAKSGSHLRLSIEAPKEFNIIRGELKEGNSST